MAHKNTRKHSRVPPPAHSTCYPPQRRSRGVPNLVRVATSAHPSARLAPARLPPLHGHRRTVALTTAATATTAATVGATATAAVVAVTDVTATQSAATANAAHLAACGRRSCLSLRRALPRHEGIVHRARALRRRRRRVRHQQVRGRERRGERRGKPRIAVGPVGPVAVGSPVGPRLTQAGRRLAHRLAHGGGAVLQPCGGAGQLCEAPLHRADALADAVQRALRVRGPPPQPRHLGMQG